MADVEDYVVKIIERDLLPKYPPSIDGVVDGTTSTAVA